MKTGLQENRLCREATHRSPVLVAHVLYSFGIGGLEKGIATVINHGSGRFRHVIVCLGGGRASRSLLQKPVEILELHKPLGNSARFILHLAALFRRLRPDIVHTRNWGGMDGIVAARLAGVRNLVHGEHGWDLSDPFGVKRRRLLTRRLLSPLVKEYTCVSEQMRLWLQIRVGVGRKRVTRIYNGIDTERFRPGPNPSLREALGLAPGDFVVGTVSRLDPIKDHGTLLSAFRRLQPMVPAARLLVVGDGPRLAELKRQEGDGVIFLGERSDVEAILKTLDVYVLPSINEGISNTILEAMASGLPVVATRVGGNPELVEDGGTGRMVPPGDPEALAETIAKYARDGDLRRVHGQMGRLRAETNFSIRAMVQAYEAVWDRAQPGE